MGKSLDLTKIYSVSPVWVQTVGISLYGLMWKHRRFGGIFSEELRKVKEREYLANWSLYQIGSLRKLITHSLENVPYYQRRFIDAGLEPGDVASFNLDDLRRLPMLEKDELRKDPSAFVSKKTSVDKLHCYHTSGTSGTPVSIYFSTRMHQLWSAHYEARIRNWAGVNNRERRAMIGGRLVVPRGVSSPPFWRKNWAEGQLYMSAFHISPANAPLYLEAIRKFRPTYLVGYASSWFFLSRFIVEQGLRRFPVKAVLTSSEKLTEEMRGTIQQAFECEVFDAYSGVEACCLASECERHGLHVSPDVGIIELLGDDGRPVSPGETGEIVATGLLNFDQPLIRFRTGDYAACSEEKCPCGREMPLLKELVGRLEDTVIGPDGRETVRFHGLFVGMKNVREGQVIQEALSRIRLRVMPAPGFGTDDAEELRKRVIERLGPVETIVETVDSIERTNRGKFKAVISHVERRLN